MIFPTHIAHTPCDCKVTYYLPYVAMRITGTGFGDAEPPQEQEFDFELLDIFEERNTYLESKVTPEDKDRLLEEFLCACKAEDYAIY